MKKIVIVTLSAVLIGCATQAKFQAKMDRFIGQPEGVIVGTYGPPQNSYVLDDGSKVLQYTRSGTIVMQGATTYQPVISNTSGNMTLNQGVRTTTGTYNQTTTSYVPQQAQAIPINLSCTVNFTISKDGVVQLWSAEGNNCVSN
jgi:hypothetical protein